MKRIFGRMKMLKHAVVLLITTSLIVATSAVMANIKNIQTEESSHLNFNGIGSMDDVIWDNGQPGTWTIASQLDTGYPFNAQAADDFMFDTETDVTGVGWYGHFWNGPPDEINPCDFNIYIYADDGTGNAPTGGGMQNPETTALESYFFEDVLGVSIGEHAFSYELNLPSPFTAQPQEKYWIVFQAKFDFQPQWGWLNTDNPVQLSPAVQGFPALEVPFWTPTEHGDQAFYLLGGGGGGDPALEIDSITGGIGFKITVKNTGDAEATDCAVDIDIQGGLFILQRNYSLAIGNIGPGNSTIGKASVFGIGLGFLTELPTIAVNVSCAEGKEANETVNARIFLALVLIQ